MFDCYDPALAALQTFLHGHSEALQNAALLLGGQPALKATRGLLDEICASPALTRRLRRDLGKLHALLSLEHVHDPERPEAACFAAIDPSWSCVEEICLLADELAEVLDAVIPTEALTLAPRAA